MSDNLCSSEPIELKPDTRKSILLSVLNRLVREPLNTILGSAQLLKSDSVSENIAERLDTIIDGAKKIPPLFEEMRYFLDLEDDFFDKNANSCANLKLYFEGFVKNYQKKSRKKSITFYFNYGKNLPDWAMINQYFLSNILHNILSNAVKYTDQGAISLTVKTNKNNGVVNEMSIIISDTGCGMSPATQACLFNLFDYELTTGVYAFSKAGISLAVSAKMTRMMGGTLEVESRINQGSTFILTIPLNKTEQPVYRNLFDVPLVQPSILKPKKRSRDSLIEILSIEDNTIAQQIIKMMLEQQYNCKIEQVTTLTDAIKCIGKHYDIIFVDLNLPDGTGVEFLKTLHQQMGKKAPPTIIVTSYVSEEASIMIGEAGGLDMIPKPIDKKDVVRMIEQYVFTEWLLETEEDD